MTSHATAAGLGRLIGSGRVDPVELVEQVYEQLAQSRDAAIFITLTRERALQEAKAARRRARAGNRRSLLDGVPMAWKDLTHMAGCVTTFGSALYRDHAAETEDAPVVANAAAAGIVSVGKTNLSEFAFSGLGANTAFGTPRNPHDDRVHRLPGGSSAGSAAAVARGIVPLASGSDTAGSVRIPASWCGIVGYHGSLGSFDMTGSLPLSRHLDTLGILAGSVEDCILAARAMHDRVVSLPKAPPIGAFSILVPENDVFDDIQDEVLENFDRFLKTLRKAGARIKRKRVETFSGIRALMAKHGHIGGAEAWYFHKDELEGPDSGLIDPFVAHRIRMASTMTAYDLLCIMAERDRLIAQFADETKGFDVIAFPTNLSTAPRLDEAIGNADAFMTQAGRAIRNTVLGNFLKLCGLALPTGVDRNGLPTSIAFAARQAEDERLLAVGLALERAGRP